MTPEETWKALQEPVTGNCFNCWWERDGECPLTRISTRYGMLCVNDTNPVSHSKDNATDSWKWDGVRK